MRCARFAFPSGSLDSAQQTEARPERDKHVEKSHGRTPLRVSQKSDPGDDHAGSVRESCWEAPPHYMPIFADQILHCGPVGLGWLRAMPAIGAFAMALVVAHLPPMKRAGQALLWCVSGFGIATVLLACLRSSGYRSGLLLLIGAFDSVSVIIRGSIVQLITPDEMRGRVSSVNNIFIGTSNEFGALESGLTACAVWSGDFGRCRRHWDNAGCVGRCVSLAGDAQDRRAGPDLAMKMVLVGSRGPRPGRYQRHRLQLKRAVQ